MNPSGNKNTCGCIFLNTRLLAHKSEANVTFLISLSCSEIRIAMKYFNASSTTQFTLILSNSYFFNKIYH